MHRGSWSSPVASVGLFDELSVKSLVGELYPDQLFKGGDYEVDHEIVGAQAVVVTGGGLKPLPNCLFLLL